jgi:hypothetical protein
MAAVRKELDEEYEAAVGLNVRPSKGGAQAAPGPNKTWARAGRNGPATASSKASLPLQTEVLSERVLLFLSNLVPEREVPQYFGFRARLHP